MPRRLLLAAVVIAVATGLTALPPRASQARGLHGEPAGRVLTPVLSARRVPTLLAGVVADRNLAGSLDAALADPALGPAPGATCLAVSTGGRRLFERRPDQPLIPASNLKLLTATAVLHELGPDARLRTEVRGTVGPDGVVSGDIWLVGGGDPLLATRDGGTTLDGAPYTSLEELAKRVVAAGVRQVRGRVLGDESRYDAQRYLPSWSATYRAAAVVGPQSALTVNGNTAAWHRGGVAADRPAANAAAVFTGLLKTARVEVAGPPDQGVAPPGTPTIAALDSLPMSEVVGEMLRESDNLTAELLTKELGRWATGAGTTAAGVTAIRAVLTRLGLPTAGLAAVDGSGLDRSDRATCRLLLATVEAAGDGSVLARGFPVANRSGTLEDDFERSPAAGRVRAKTGSLQGVAALTGFAEGSGTTLAFSLLANGMPTEAVGRRLWERVGAALVAYPQAPPPDQLGPRTTP